MKGEKSRIRSEFKKIRKELPQPRKEKARVNSFIALKKIAINHLKILSFCPLPDEIDLSNFNSYLADEKKLLLPKISGKKLDIYHVLNLTELKPNLNFSMLEPKVCQASLIQDLDIITLALVPGLAFDSYNGRIGFGMGYYDLLLSKLKKCYKIGIGFKEQRYQGKLPLEIHDISLDEVLLF
jgi:5-formyltetrahydrofolate cyclo-ligase